MSISNITYKKFRTNFPRFNQNHSYDIYCLYKNLNFEKIYEVWSELTRITHIY
jgi:hypothetical protein